jgi:hypothetical protein
VLVREGIHQGIDEALRYVGEDRVFARIVLFSRQVRWRLGQLLRQLGCVGQSVLGSKYLAALPQTSMSSPWMLRLPSRRSDSALSGMRNSRPVTRSISIGLGMHVVGAL